MGIMMDKASYHNSYSSGCEYVGYGQHNECNHSCHKELIHVPCQTNLQVCLVKTGLGMPFISGIELRPLSNKTYETNFGSLALFARLDVGSSISYR